MAKALTLPQLFFKQAEQHSSESAFYYCRKRDRKWVDMTWKKYREEVESLCEWLKRQGVEKGDKVAILSENRPEWLISELAILTIGAVCVPLYANASVHDVFYILEHSEASLLIVDDLEKVEYLKHYPVKTILSFDRASKTLVQSFKPYVAFYSELKRVKPKTSMQPVPVEDQDLALLIYTSGTTGRPKAVMHTHASINAAREAIFQHVKPIELYKDRYFSFLPLSHVAEQALVVLGSIATGSEVSFARSIDTLGEDLFRCRPTILLCVPRLWEKIYEKINANLLIASPLKIKMFQFAKKLGEQSRIDGTKIYKKNVKNPFYALASDYLVGQKLKYKLGLDRCRILLTGAAPTRPEVMKFFGAFGLVIREVYGLTENLCLGVLNDEDVSIIGSCGRPFEGNEVAISEDGEVLFRAPWNFVGYYKDPEATKNAITEDGWLRTGDLGRIDEERCLHITGRKKELLKTSGGKYVAPVPIEDRLKTWPAIQDAVVVGDTRKYCVALISLNRDVLQTKDPKVIKKEISVHLKRINEPLASFETIKRIGILREGLSIEKGHLTPTLKVKRNEIHVQHQKFIDQIYSSEDDVIYEGS